MHPSTGPGTWTGARRAPRPAAIAVSLWSRRRKMPGPHRGTSIQQLKTCQNLPTSLSWRGFTAGETEWLLAATAHNLRKPHRHPRRELATIAVRCSQPWGRAIDNRALRRLIVLRGVAIKSGRTGNLTDPGHLALGKSGRHGAARWRELTCCRRTSAARSASCSLVESGRRAEASGAGRSYPRSGQGVRGSFVVG